MLGLSESLSDTVISARLGNKNKQGAEYGCALKNCLTALPCWQGFFYKNS